jgi:uncharacterized membrane protein (UPF0136 family)
MASNNQAGSSLVPDVIAGNISPPAATVPEAAAKPANAANPASGASQTGQQPPAGPNATRPSKFGKGLALTAGVLAESGAGFGVGTMLAQNNKTGTNLLVVVATLIFVMDVVLRYRPEAPGKFDPWVLMLIGVVCLTAAALIPYNIIQAAPKTKGKAAAGAATPVMAGAWIVSALAFTVGVASKGVKVQESLQGAIISIMYMALSSIAGYHAQTKQVGTSTFAASIWGLLALFDGIGLART